MLLPKTRFTEQDDAAGWKIALFKAKAIRDSCIDPKGLPGTGAGRNRRWVLTPKYFKRQIGCGRPKRSERFDKPAYDALTDVGIVGP